MKPKATLRHFLLLIGSSLLAISSSRAGQTWDGGSTGPGDNNWSTGANWDVDDLVPNFASTITFVGNTRNGAVNDLAAATGIGGINFTNDGSAGNTNAFTLSGASINLNSNITTTAITTGPTITDEISLNMNMNGGGRSVTTGLGHDLTVSGVISGGFSFFKNGAGTLTLSNLNSFSNNFVVTAGTVNANTILTSGVANPQSLGTSQNIIFASTNGESVVNYTGGATNITTKFLALGTGNGVAGGQFEGLVGRLNNNGSGAMVFNSANLNAIYTGVLTTTARTLVLGGANTDANTVGILRDNGVPGGGGNASINLRKEDAGTWIFRAANTYTGTTTVNGGILKLNHNLALQNSALVTTGAGFLTFESGITSPTIGGLSGASGNLATIFSSGYGSVTALTLNPQSGVSVSYGGLISNGSGAMPLTKTGAGNQTLTGNNTFSGAVTISNGSITVSSMKNLGVAQPLGGGGDPQGAGRIDISNGGTLIYNGTGDTSSRTFICNGGTGTIDASNPSGKLTLTGLWYRTAAANSTYALKGTGLAELTQKIGTGAGGGSTTVTKSGTGTWILSVVPGQDSSYAGGTNVNEGTLLATVAIALPSYSTLGKVAVASGATLAVRANQTSAWTSAQINSLLTPANFVAGSNLGVDVDDLVSFTYANNIGITQAAKGLVKSGLGTLTLSVANTYTGATKVSGGSLEITGATQATSSITVDSGAKLGLTISSPVTAANAAVDLTNGTVKVTGTTGAPSYTLMTASSIVPLHPVLASPIPGYQLVVVGGTELQLNQVASAPEIAVDQGGDIPNITGSKGFGTHTIGTNNDLVFTINNTGDAALNLTGSPDLVAISGHPDFTVTVQPATNPVPATSGSTTFTVRFTPQASGARSATISIANDDSDEGPFTFTLNGTGQTPYAAWSGGASFGGDANGDGVKDGVAYLLGATTPGTNATSLLPKASQSGGNLIMEFDCLATAARGASSVLNLQYDGDLVAPWTSAAVPGAVGNTTVGNVSFEATANGDLIHIKATVNDATEAATGKLFGRLEGSQP